LSGANSDPDDVQSMVRFLLYTNDFDVEGMVASAGTRASIARKVNILSAIDKYAQVVDNLRKHDPRYPSPDSLRAVTFQGRDGTWGKGGDVVGDGHDTEASNAIIDIVDKPDPRPVWFSVWGGTCEVAQAIYKVKKTRSAEELDQFISKMRIYQIANQDGSAGWMNKTFPKLFIINSTASTYWGMTCSGGDTSLCNNAWLDANIRNNHGPLGAVYPPRGCCVSGVQEGDSPSFMHLVSASKGMNDPEDPTQPSWGGQYVRSGTTNHWNDGPGSSTISKYRADFQKEFALRADWMLP
jgi:hypothetical protein